MSDPHVMLNLGHILFGGGLLGKRPGQHELGFEDRCRRLHDAVEGSHHPGNGGMLHAALDIGDTPAGVALVPGAIELLGRGSKLHDEVTGQVLRLGLPTLLAPESDQGRFVAAYDDAGVRAADEEATIQSMLYLLAKWHCSLLYLTTRSDSALSDHAALP